VQRHELVVRFRGEQTTARPGKLEPDYQRLDAADDQKRHRGHQVARADRLVIDGR